MHQTEGMLEGIEEEFFFLIGKGFLRVIILGMPYVSLFLFFRIFENIESEKHVARETQVS